jgi:hypothetical protein
MSNSEGSDNTGRTFPDDGTDPSKVQPPLANVPDTNDRIIPTQQEFRALLGVSYPSGNAQINSVFAPLIAGDKFYVQGSSYIQGPILTVVQAARGIILADGTAMNPSLAFASDIHTGIYKSNIGTVGFTSGGLNQVSIGGNAINVNVPITTPNGQNLVIDPSGPSVDFTNHTLINVAGISENPNYVTVLSPATVITTDATPTTLLTITTMPYNAYTITCDIALTDDSDLVSTGSFSLQTKGKNIAGVVTVVPYLRLITNTDSGLSGVSAIYSSSGSNIIVQITGLAGTTIKWFGSALVTLQSF